MGRKRVYYIVFKEDGKFPEEKAARRWGMFLIPWRRKPLSASITHRVPLQPPHNTLRGRGSIINNWYSLLIAIKILEK